MSILKEYKTFIFIIPSILLAISSIFFNFTHNYFSSFVYLLATPITTGISIILLSSFVSAFYSEILDFETPSFINMLIVFSLLTAIILSVYTLIDNVIFKNNENNET